MLDKIKRWYNGTPILEEHEDDEGDSSVSFLPMFYVEYHWTAKAARSVVSFYIRHWKWVWGTAITVVGIFLASR